MGGGTQFPGSMACAPLQSFWAADSSPGITMSGFFRPTDKHLSVLAALRERGTPYPRQNSLVGYSFELCSGGSTRRTGQTFEYILRPCFSASCFVGWVHFGFVKASLKSGHKANSDENSERSYFVGQLHPACPTPLSVLNITQQKQPSQELCGLQKPSLPSDGKYQRHGWLDNRHTSRRFVCKSP